MGRTDVEPHRRNAEPSTTPSCRACPEAIAYCDKFPLDDMPDDAVNLLHLVYSFVIVSFPVELWRQKLPPDTAGTAFVRLSEPLP